MNYCIALLLLLQSMLVVQSIASLGDEESAVSGQFRSVVSFRTHFCGLITSSFSGQ
jgi:hypothetical protein